MTEEYSKYELARIVGARALQISMNAPILLRIPEETLERIGYDPIKISEMEVESGVLPITIKRPFPKKVERKITEEKREEENKNEIEKKEEEIVEEGEIMDLAHPEDEFEVEETEEAAMEEYS